MHSVKIVLIWSFFWSVFFYIRTDTGIYGPEKAPYIDTSHSDDLFTELDNWLIG